MYLHIELFLQFNAYIHGYYDDDGGLFGISSSRILEISLLLSFISNVFSSVKVFESRGLGLHLSVLIYALADTLSRGLSVSLWKESQIGQIATICSMVIIWQITLFWIFWNYTEMRRAWGFDWCGSVAILVIAFVLGIITILSATPLICTIFLYEGKINTICFLITTLH